MRRGGGWRLTLARGVLEEAADSLGVLRLRMGGAAAEWLLRTCEPAHAALGAALSNMAPGTCAALQARGVSPGALAVGLCVLLLLAVALRCLATLRAWMRRAVAPRLAAIRDMLGEIENMRSDAQGEAHTQSEMRAGGHAVSRGTPGPTPGRSPGSARDEAAGGGSRPTLARSDSWNRTHR